MRRVLALVIAVSLYASNMLGEDYVLPAFALRVVASNDTAWTSEVYVTNLGPDVAHITEGAFLPGRRSDTPPCLPIVQPFIEVPPATTVLWRTGELSLGVGCPEFATGGLMFHSDRPVVITSRVVNHARSDRSFENPLSGIGQEIRADDLLGLPRPGDRVILPAIGWHPNSCGPSLLDTNVFFANPEGVPVRVEIDPEAGEPDELRIDGELVSAPYVFEVPPFSQRVLRLAGPGSPMLPVCLEPRIGSFTYRASGGISVVASVIDRRSGDARTSEPVPVRE